ncbi:FecR protein [Planctomycetes bacterium MalM25]|nr:FecR protein [Planctomycetes bacterium MalM25]
MSTRDESTELIALIETVLNGSASLTEVRRLDELLEESAAARSTYLDYVDLHAGLRRRYSHPAEEPSQGRQETSSANRLDAAQGVAPPRGGKPSGAWRMLGLMALAACVPLAVAQFIRPGNDSQKAEGLAEVTISPDQKASLAGVAVLSRAVDVEWSEGELSHAEGVAVPASKIAFDSGVMQLEFYSGAVAVIEGPAEIDVIDAMSARLHSGKLRARVPPQARGFTVHTSDGEVVDLGTEFAIDLGADREWGELHVIDGEVRFDPVQETGHASRQVFGGEAMRLGSDPHGEHGVELTTDRFIGTAEIEKISRQRKTKRHRRWRQWRSEFLADPDLVAWYGYSPEPEWSRTLRNYAPQGSDDSHGVLVGCQWGPGRWPNQRALRFRNASHRVSVNLPGQHESITLATWAYLDKLHPTNQVALMHADTLQPRLIHWTLDRVPSGALLHFSESSTPQRGEVRRLHYSSKRGAIQNEDAGSWLHFALVYDADLKRVTHYCNGEVVGWAPIIEVRPIEIGVADIGNWPYKYWAKGTEFETRNLMGRIDEFVVVGRAMSGSELAEMYKVGKP